MLRRCLVRETVFQVVLFPDNIITDRDDAGISIYQSIVFENEQKFLYRIFVNTRSNPHVIVTLYITTKIKKYYEDKI